MTRRTQALAAAVLLLCAQTAAAGSARLRRGQATATRAQVDVSTAVAVGDDGTMSLEQMKLACTSAILTVFQDAAKRNASIDQFTMTPPVAAACLVDHKLGTSTLHGDAHTQMYGFLDLVGKLLQDRLAMPFSGSDGVARCPTTVSPLGPGQSVPESDDDADASPQEEASASSPTTSPATGTAPEQEAAPPAQTQDGDEESKFTLPPGVDKPVSARVETRLMDEEEWGGSLAPAKEQEGDASSPKDGEQADGEQQPEPTEKEAEADEEEQQPEPTEQEAEADEEKQQPAPTEQEAEADEGTKEEETEQTEQEEQAPAEKEEEEQAPGEEQPEVEEEEEQQQPEAAAPPTETDAPPTADSSDVQDAPTQEQPGGAAEATGSTGAAAEPTVEAEAGTGATGAADEELAIPTSPSTPLPEAVMDEMLKDIINAEVPAHTGSTGAGGQVVDEETAEDRRAREEMEAAAREAERSLEEAMKIVEESEQDGASTPATSPPPQPEPEVVAPPPAATAAATAGAEAEAEVPELGAGAPTGAGGADERDPLAHGDEEADVPYSVEKPAAEGGAVDTEEAGPILVVPVQPSAPSAPTGTASEQLEQVVEEHMPKPEPVVEEPPAPEPAPAPEPEPEPLPEPKPEPEEVIEVVAPTGATGLDLPPLPPLPELEPAAPDLHTTVGTCWDSCHDVHRSDNGQGFHSCMWSCMHPEQHRWTSAARECLVTCEPDRDDVAAYAPCVSGCIKTKQAQQVGESAEAAMLTSQGSA